MAATATRNNNDARIEFRLPSELKARIERAAMATNRSLTDFATSAIGEAAGRVLNEQDAHAVLSDRDRERFLSMLDSSAPANAALLSAAKKHRRRVSR